MYSITSNVILVLVTDSSNFAPIFSYFNDWNNLEVVTKFSLSRFDILTNN